MTEFNPFHPESESKSEPHDLLQPDPASPIKSNRWRIIQLLGALSLGFFLAWWLPTGHPGTVPEPALSEVESSAELWTCGMHPHVLEDEPGLCPICNMNLVPVAPEMSPSSGSELEMEGQARRIEFYRHPMDPSITSPVPAKDPMGMDYLPVYSEGSEPSARSSTAITIDSRVQQNMNLKTSPVLRRDLDHRVRTVGALDYDPERMISITTKYSGWIEKAHVHQIGEEIRQGQPLFEVYSPDLIQTGEELLAALRFAQAIESTTDATQLEREASARANDLVQAARQRLRYWDVTPEQIRQLEASRKVPRTLTVSSPSNGVLMYRPPALEGMAVSPGAELIHLADLSRLWVTVEVFEEQLAWVTEGTEATIELSYFPGELFQGTVRYLEPELSPKTRTLGARIEILNPTRRLRKGMFAEVELRSLGVSGALVVPDEAILRTGERNVVIVVSDSDSERVFEPRVVVPGIRQAGTTEIRSGLDEGETVVTSSQFLLDSESQIQSTIRQMMASRENPNEGSP